MSGSRLRTSPPPLRATPAPPRPTLDADADAAAQFAESCGPALHGLPAPARALLEGVAGASPYLRRLALKRKDGLAAMFDAPAQETLAAAIVAAADAGSGESADAQMKILREAKQEAALLIAFADIGGAWDVTETTAALSRFADAAVEGALAGAVTPGSGRNRRSVRKT